MEIIYQPKGKAGEYARLALNLYNGCTHGCKYCYCTKAPFISGEFHQSSSPKKEAIARLNKDCRKLQQLRDCPEILLSFQGDPYQPDEIKHRLSRQAIETLIMHTLPFTILTKGAFAAERDFDLLNSYPWFRLGVSMSFVDPVDCLTWEPEATSPQARINLLWKAKASGIKTWVSLEPVIDPDQALQIIRKCHSFVDHWKIGKINHHPGIEKQVDWIKFRSDVVNLLQSLRADYYIKNSLTGLDPYTSPGRP